MEKSKELQKYQDQIANIPVYRETLKKQEKVILKLEKLMEETLSQTENAKTMAK